MSRALLDLACIHVTLELFLSIRLLLCLAAFDGLGLEPHDGGWEGLVGELEGDAVFLEHLLDECSNVGSTKHICTNEQVE